MAAKLTSFLRFCIMVRHSWDILLNMDKLRHTSAGGLLSLKDSWGRTFIVHISSSGSLPTYWLEVVVRRKFIFRNQSPNIEFRVVNKQFQVSTKKYFLRLLKISCQKMENTRPIPPKNYFFFFFFFFFLKVGGI